MKLATVIGTVTCTIKDPSLEGQKILLIQPLDDDQKPVGRPIASIDTSQAGEGDLVYWVLSREAAFALPNSFAPVDSAIVGIVDEVYKEDIGIYNKEEIFGSGN